jgi:hypothetical protein
MVNNRVRVYVGECVGTVTFENRPSSCFCLSEEPTTDRVYFDPVSNGADRNASLQLWICVAVDLKCVRLVAVYLTGEDEMIQM